MEKEYLGRKTNSSTTKHPFGSGLLGKDDKSIVESLKKIKEFSKQTYNELISEMIELFKNVKKRNQYDEFLHKIQQHKMKELWDNREDEVWEDA